MSSATALGRAASSGPAGPALGRAASTGVATGGDKAKLDRGLSWAIATDGSKLTKDAFVLVSEHLRQDPRDYIAVVYVDDPSKGFLPYELQPGPVGESFAVKGTTLYPKGHFAFRKFAKGDQPTKSAVVAAVATIAPPVDILVVGMVGRKGPKEDPHVLGSVTDLSMRESHTSCLIVKRLPAAGGTTLAVGVDGSTAGHTAALLALRLARPGVDKVVLINVNDRAAQPGHRVDRPALPETGEPGADACAAHKTSPEEVEETYRALIAALEPAAAAGASFKAVVRAAGGGSVADTFLDAADEADADLIVLGMDGLHHHASHGTANGVRVGSNTDAIVRRARVNVLAVVGAQSTVFPYHSHDNE